MTATGSKPEAAQPPSFTNAGVRPVPLHCEHLNVDAQSPQPLDEACVEDIAA